MTNLYSPPQAPVADMMLSPAGLKLEYELFKRDYFMFNLVHQFRMPVMQLFTLGLAVLIAFDSSSHGAWAAFIGLVVYIAIWLCQVVFVFLAIVTGDKRLYTKFSTTPSSEHLVVETQYARHEYRWHGIEKVVNTPWSTAIYVNKNAAQIIPARAFRNQQTRRDFLTFLDSNIVT